MAEINSIYVPIPFSVNVGGTGNTLPLNPGEIWIGTSVGSPTVNALTPGNNITIDNSSDGNITISSGVPSATILPDPTSAVALQGNTTYITTNNSGGITTFTLPVSPNAGDFYEIIGGGTQGWRISQNAGQQIAVGNVSTTVGTGGNIQSVTPTGGVFHESIIIYCQSSTVFLGIPLVGQVNVL